MTNIAENQYFVRITRRACRPKVPPFASKKINQIHEQHETNISNQDGPNSR